MKTKKIETLPDGYLRITLDKGEVITTTQTWTQILRDERRKKLIYLNYNIKSGKYL